MLSKYRKEINGITIDGYTSRDLDDAFWLEEVGNESYLLHISISDVGAVIPLNSELDDYAKKRVFSRYLSHSTKSMFPKRFSNNLLSLLENKERKTITISISIDKNGVIHQARFNKTILISQQKLSYEKSAMILEEPKNPLHDMLNKCHNLAQNLFQKRKKRGAITIYSLRNRITTTEDGLVRMLKPEESYNSHILIQEFMILTNQIVARFFAENDIPALYRNHTAKSFAPKREMLINDVNSVVNSLDYGRIETMVEKFALIFNKANYSPVIEGHYALNLPAYAHFTSPIRRYADLVNLRQLSAFIDGEDLPYSFEQLQEIGGHINAVTLKYKEEKNEYFKAQNYRKNMEFLIRENFSDVEDRDFYHLIKMALVEDRLPEKLKHEILSRMEAGKLEVRDLYQLLFRSKNNGEWSLLKPVILEWLISNLHLNPSILMMASQKLEWGTPKFTTKSTGEDHTPIFYTTATIDIKGKEFIADTNSLNSDFLKSKKISIQIANLLLISEITGVELDFDNTFKELHHNSEKSDDYTIIETAIETAKDEFEAFYSGKNYTGVLNELCQKNKWLYAKFEYELSGQDHQPEISAIAKIEIDGTKYMSEKMLGSSKKQAKNMASYSLLEKIIHLKP